MPAKDKAPTIRKVRVDLIDANPDQPRKKFDHDEIAALASSIHAQGQQSPIGIRPKGKRFEIVYGERRWRAHQLLGRKTIDAIVRTMSEFERDLAAIVENLARVDIEPLEEAHAFERLIKQGMNPEQIASHLGLAVFRVNWRLQLLNLTPQIRTLFAHGNLDRQQALELARLPAPAQERVHKLVATGKVVGWKALRNTVDAHLDGEAQVELFGASAPKPSREEVQKVGDMEARIASVARMVSAGWKDGECIIACRVSPDRAGLMADEIAVLRNALSMMERDLRNTLGQAHAATLLEA